MREETKKVIDTLVEQMPDYGVYTVLKPFTIWVQVGMKQTNAYYGNARISAPEYEKVKARKGDEIEWHARGAYHVTKSKTHVVRFAAPKSGQFERDNYYPDAYITAGMKKKELAYMGKRGNLTSNWRAAEKMAEKHLY